MVTPTKGARLGSSPAHERLILANLATSLYEHGKIKTTVVRARRVQPLAERLITIAKKGTLAARRQIMATIRDKSVVHSLMTELAEQFAERDGGYTRITKIERRKGDQAEMAIIELVSEPVVKKATVKKAADKATNKSTSTTKVSDEETADTSADTADDTAADVQNETPAVSEDTDASSEDAADTVTSEKADDTETENTK